MVRFFSPTKLTVLALLLVLVLSYGFRTQLLTGIGSFLVVSDPLQPADLIFLLNGDPTVRPNQAARLLREGWAPKIVIARAEDSTGVLSGAYPNVTDSNIVVLRQLGVSDGQIVQLRPPGGVQSTFDEATALLKYSREQGIRNAIIVTSELHSRRSRFIFRRVARGSPVKILLAPVPDRKYGPNNWWQIEDGVIGCQNEYIKLLYYHYKY